MADANGGPSEPGRVPPLEHGAFSTVGVGDDVQALREALGVSTRPLLVACLERRSILVTFLACARLGRTVLFAPNTKVERLRELARNEDADLVHDGALTDGIDVRSFLGSRRTTDPEPLQESDQVLAVFHTSGSTGTPTAVPKTARQLIREADLWVATLGLTGADRVLATVPSFHLYGFLFGVLVPLRAGASIVDTTPVAPGAIERAIAASGATVLVSVPAHLRALSAFSREPLRVSRVVSSGAPLSADDADAARHTFGSAVTEVLGSTEAGGIASRQSPDVGYTPLPPVEVSIDRDGSLTVRSPFATNDGTTWLSTGDRARWESPGRFVHLGRADDIVKIGGKRVSASELEECLRALPGVRDACVRPVHATRSRGERLAAVVAADGLASDALRRELVARFDEVVVPRVVRVVDVIPRNENGKVTDATFRALAFASNDVGEARLRLVASPSDATTFTVHVPADLPVFRGHFAGHPLLPGVMQIRTLVLAAIRNVHPELGAVRRALRVKFRRPIPPGCDVRVSVARSGASTVTYRIHGEAIEFASGILELETRS